MFNGLHTVVERVQIEKDLQRCSHLSWILPRENRSMNERCSLHGAYQMDEPIVEHILCLSLNIMTCFEDELEVFLDCVDARKIRVHREMI